MSQEISLGPLSSKENKSSVSPTKEIRKIRVQLSDRVFELRKMSQDYAEEKAHIFMNHSTEKNHLNSIISELKHKITQQNEHWSSKVDQIRKDHQEEINNVNISWKAKINEEVNKLTIEMRTYFEKEIAQLSSTIARSEASLKKNKKLYEHEIYQTTETHRREISNVLENKEKSLIELKKNIQKDEEFKINTLMQLKDSSEKQQKKAKQILKKKQQQFNQQKAKHQIRIFELKQQLWSTKKQLEEKNKRNRELQVLIEIQENQKKETVQISVRQYEEKINNIEDEWKNNLESLNQKWKSQYKKMQTNFQKAHNAMNEKEKLWQERGNTVLQLYQQRQARQEDVKLIQTLQVQLIKKQFQLEREKQQLKSCKLQLDNMDDIYKRVFYSANKRNSNSFNLKKVKLPGIINRSTNPLKNTIDN